VLLDTGRLIAMINRGDRNHLWVLVPLGQIVPPMLTCDAVLAEACYLAPRTGRPATELLALAVRGVVRSAFDLGDNTEQVMSLMTRYENVPMSLADACLVRMSELIPDSKILTLDSDFHIYRRHRRQRILVQMPDNR
jgi:predicted nucleic acid-binding protein